MSDKYPKQSSKETQLRTYSHYFEEQNQSRNLTRLQVFWSKILQIVDILKPYVRLIRIVVTFIAPILLMVLYVIHSSMRTKKIQRFIRNFKSDRAFISGSLQSHTNGIMELT